MCIFNVWHTHGCSGKPGFAFWWPLRSLLAWPESLWSASQSPGPSGAEPRWASGPTGICDGQMWWHAQLVLCEDDLEGCVLCYLSAASCRCLITVMNASGGALLFAGCRVFMFHHLSKSSPSLTRLTPSTFSPISLGVHHLFSLDFCFLSIIQVPPDAVCSFPPF